jgi:ParB-like chromosome segregation protein Spo0J
MIQLSDGRLLERIDTMAEFLEIRKLIVPVYITSRARGQILVPCMNTLLVKYELVVENLHNPNTMSPEKLEGLAFESIPENGMCFPVVVICDDEQVRFVIIDGAHRDRALGPDWLDCDYIPVVVLAHDMSKCLAATWVFNKLRGHHAVELDAELIRRLVGQGLTDEQIAEKLTVDVDTVYRYKQVTGVAELFRNAEWSRAWEMREDEPAPGSSRPPP